MLRRNDTDSAPPVDDAPDEEEAADGQPVGTVEFDNRGKAIWRWARDMLDSTSILLKRLDNKDLALEPTQRVPAMGKAGHAKNDGRSEPRATRSIELSLSDPGSRDGVGGFDPYNSGN